MRPRRRLALAGATLLLLVGTAAGIDQVLWRGAHAAAVASAVGAVARNPAAILDPASIFAARSPGARGSGPLQQTKPERVAATSLDKAAAPDGPPGPEERVLAAVRERPPELDFPPPDAPAPLGRALPSLANAGPPPPVAFASAPNPLGPTGLAGPPFVPGTPPGDGGTPPGGGPPPNTPQLPPVSAVPEPSAWMLMILAVFGVGAALRRRRASARTADDASARFHA